MQMMSDTRKIDIVGILVEKLNMTLDTAKKTYDDWKHERETPDQLAAIQKAFTLV